MLMFNFNKFNFKKFKPETYIEYKNTSLSLKQSLI